MKKTLLTYYIKRIFRIYPALIAALLLGAVIARFYTLPASNNYTSESIRYLVQNAQAIHGLGDYIKCFILENVGLDNPTWSIRAEVACSFALPFLICLLIRFKKSLIIILITLGFYLWMGSGPLHFLLMFLLGYLIYRSEAVLKNLTAESTKILLLLGLTVWVCSICNSWNWLLEGIILSFILALLVPCNLVPLKNFLNIRPLQYLGKISYSFYLLHMPILLLIVSFFTSIHQKATVQKSPGPLEPLELFLSSVAIALILASFSERYIEKPFNKIGHALASKTKHYLAEQKS